MVIVVNKAVKANIDPNPGTGIVAVGLELSSPMGETDVSLLSEVVFLSRVDSKIVVGRSWVEVSEVVVSSVETVVVTISVVRL